MTSEERIEKVEKLLEKAALPDSKASEILKEILKIEKDTIRNAIDSSASFELPYLVFILEAITKFYKSQLAVQPNLKNIYAFLNLTFDTNCVAVTMPKPRSKKND